MIVLKQIEATPESYPTPMSPMPDNADVVWARIESYVAHRWTERQCVWVVEGPGEFNPPLSPVTVSTVEIWAGEWQAIEAEPSPLGFWLPGAGPYRFTAIVGGGDSELPAAVLEAFTRLSNYMAAKPGKPGATSESVTAGSITLAHRRSASWLANAIDNSGAGDLLRPYRRA